MPWLFNESSALKSKLSGLVVEDVNAPRSGRSIPVRFNLVETEISEQSFPMIVIQFSGATRAVEREHRGRVYIPYAPEGADKWWADGATTFNERESPYTAEFPVPYDLDYQITVYSRKSSHDLMLTAMLAAPDRLPSRFGYLEIPQDGTARRLDLMAGPEPFHEEDSNGKRMFRSVYSVRISSEYPPSVVARAALVGEVDIDLERIPDGVPLPPTIVVKP